MSYVSSDPWGADADTELKHKRLKTGMPGEDNGEVAGEGRWASGHAAGLMGANRSEGRRLAQL